MPNIVISGIYKIENIINHKVYIGKSVNVISRFKRGHLLINNEVNPPLKNAFKKYGYEQFSVEVIKETHDLNYWEMFLIQIYRATDKNYGYNICEGGTGGDTFSGRHHTEESKQKKREAMKRFYATKVWTDEERDRCRYWKGKHHTEEQKRKMSEVCKGINTGPKSEETKRKISQTLMGNIPWNKGIKMTEEQRLKQVEIKKKIYEGEKGEQIKQKLRDANVGNVWWNNGVIEVKSKEQPEGFLCGRINNHRNKWFTNGNVDIRFRSVVATFGSHGLLGVEDGVVFQLCPRGEGGVQVLLLPLLCLHEVGVTGVGVVHVGLSCSSIRSFLLSPIS